MRFLSLGAAITALSSIVSAENTDNTVWDRVLLEAHGQTVYWNAWGGDDNINDYIEWARVQVAEIYGVKLHHVKLIDTAAAIQVVEMEFAAGKREDGGSVDMIWINGENFARLKRQDMLGQPFVEDLPNYSLTDFESNLSIQQDFSEKTEGLESPWGLAQFTILFDTARFEKFPTTALELLSWAESNPGRFAYPSPPNFVGTTFIKQLALETMEDPSLLYSPAVENSAILLEPLWSYLEQLHPYLWRQGQAFPDSHINLRDLFNRDEIDVILTFNPGDAAALVAQEIMPPSIAPATFKLGHITNTHFLALPGNSESRAGAMVVANFLLSPAAQARKADPSIWGDTTVLDLSKLDALDRNLFQTYTTALGDAVLEPHASWVPVLEAGWKSKFSQ